MFDRDSRPTITELVVQSADSGIESADCTTDSIADPVKIGLFVRAFSPDRISVLAIMCFLIVMESSISIPRRFYLQYI